MSSITLKYAGFNTRVEAEIKKDAILKNGTMNLVGIGWNKSDKHFFQVRRK